VNFGFLHLTTYYELKVSFKGSPWYHMTGTKENDGLICQSYLQFNLTNQILFKIANHNNMLNPHELIFNTRLEGIIDNIDP
jgi:hypothetical protein